MTSGGRIGVFGGAFDPPHVGHLITAQDAFDLLGLDLLLVVPAGRPPHRETRAGPGERLALTRLAFGDDPRFEVSDIEVRREGRSWTVDTLAAIREERRPAELTLVIGVDQYRVFSTWREPERILSLARLAVMSRGGEEPEPDPAFPCRVLPVTRVDVAGTALRARIAEGRSVRYLVPESIRGRVQEIWSRNTESGEATGMDRDLPHRANVGDGC